MTVLGDDSLIGKTTSQKLLHYIMLIETYTCMYVHMYVCTYVRMDVCTYVRMYVCTYVRMDVWTYGRMDVWTYVRMYTNIIYIYICTYIVHVMYNHHKPIFGNIGKSIPESTYLNMIGKSWKLISTLSIPFMSSWHHCQYQIPSQEKACQSG